MPNYNELLQELSLHRGSLDAARKQKADLLEAAKNQPHYLAADEIAIQAAAAIADLEKRIHDAALGEYISTGNKNIHEKIKIKVFKTFKIIDPARVRDWVFNNLPAALKLDEKKVEKYAHEFGDVDGAETGEEAKCQIASEL